MRTAVQDVVFGLRLYRRRLGTVVTVGSALALAIGLATAAFSVMHGVLFPQVDLADAPRLRWVDPTPVASEAAGLAVIPRWTYAEFLELAPRATQSRLAGVLQNSARLDDSDPAETGLPVWFVSPDFFDVLGAPRPALGRWLTAADEGGAGPPPVVIGHAYWSRHLGPDEEILGRAIRLNGRPFTVVGVAPPGFAGPTATAPAFWAPLGAYDRDWRDGARLPLSSDVPVRLLVRLPGPDAVDPAEAELRSIAAGLPSRQQVREGAPLLSLSSIDEEPRVQHASDISLVVSLVLALLLLLACGNVSNLLIATGATRRAEIATRLALGASRRRIIRQLTTEGLVLMAGSAAAGWLLAGWLSPLLANLTAGFPTADVAPDTRALAFLVGTSTVTGLLSSLMPAVFGARGDLRTPLGDGAGTGSLRLQRLGSVVLGGQAALAVVLILMAVLLTRAAWRGAAVDPGYDADRLATALALTPFMAPDAARTTKLDIVERLRAVPGIADATVARFSPFSGSMQARGVVGDGDPYRLIVKPVSPEYFKVTGIRILRGAVFADPALSGDTRLAVIEDRLARTFWRDVDPIGSTLARLRPDLADVRVVGVAADVLPYDLYDEGGSVSALYMPMTTDDYRLAAVIVRTEDSPPTVERVRDALGAAAPGRRANIEVVATRLQRQADLLRTPARLASIAAAVVVGLAVVGIYGLAAFRVGQRAREIGIRMALGATPADVLRRLLQDGLRPIVIGVVAGLGLATLVLRLVSTLLLGLPIYDPVSVASTVGVLVVAAGVAIASASRHGTRLSPSVALRQE